MDNKIAIKRLTASDLTILRSKLGEISASKQKAINLNADVFTGQLYPGVNGTTQPIPLTVDIVGPASAPVYALTRKIVPPSGGYKNWRLNGEIISDPDSEPGRFNVLAPRDIAVLAFSGDDRPNALAVYFLAQNASADAAIWALLDSLIGPEGTKQSFRAISASHLNSVLDQAGADDQHPLRAASITFDDPDVEQAALGNADAARRLSKRGAGRAMSADDLARAKQRAAEVGRAGELAINTYLSLEQDDGKIASYGWLADENAVAPYDFAVVELDGSETLLDVKATEGDHARAVHISWAEVQCAAKSGRYVIFRVSGLKSGNPQLRVSSHIGELCSEIIKVVGGLAVGLAPDGFTIATDLMQWGPAIALTADPDS